MDVLERDEEERTDAATVVDRLVRAGVALAIAAVVVQSLGHLVNQEFLGTRVLLDANDDRSAWTWLSAVATVFAAFAALVHAIVFRAHRGRYAVLAATTGFLSLDDSVEIHERLGTVVRGDVLGISEGWVNRLVWPAVYFPLLVLTAALLWWLAGRAPRDAGRLIRIGLACLVAAVAFEVFTAPLPTGRGESLYTPEVVVEEGLELAGWILIAAGATAAVASALVGRAARPA